MFAILINPAHDLPVVCSVNSNLYPEYIMAGYQEIERGHKRDILDKQRELLEEKYLQTEN